MTNITTTYFRRPAMIGRRSLPSKTTTTRWGSLFFFIVGLMLAVTAFHERSSSFIVIMMADAWSSTSSTHQHQQSTTAIRPQQQQQQQQKVPFVPSQKLSPISSQTIPPSSSSSSSSALSSFKDSRRSCSSTSSIEELHRNRFPNLRHPRHRRQQRQQQSRQSTATKTRTTLTSSSINPTTILRSSSSSSSSESVADRPRNGRTPGDFPPLMLHNSKSRTKEEFQPLSKKDKKEEVSMYTCGPTVYDYAHVGNFRAFLTYDLIKRVLMYLGYDVTHICNLTDIDDKIITRANKQNIPQGQIFTDLLTKKYEQYFFDDLAALNVVMADRYPRATEHITEMMDMILALEAKGLAYEASDGSWYFATTEKEGYGQQLINLNRDEMEMTEDTDEKRDPQDFALWKAYKPGVDRDDATWESDRFQRGRPGWHLECSAMAQKYLGDTIDIHGGGIDLKFPHHENEIAQSEGVTGQTFCNCWLHNGFVNINDEKMSKSLGNFLTLRTACPTSQDVRAYRYLVMSSQYSKQLNFTPQAMDAAKSALKRIDKAMNEIKNLLSNDDGDDVDSGNNDSDIATKDVPKALKNFETALLDDLSMPRASASLFSLIKTAEKELKRLKKEGDSATPDHVGLKSIADAIHQMDEVFGIFYEVPLTEEEEKELAANNGGGGGGDGSSSSSSATAVPSEVMELVMQRVEAKESKDWDLADSLRSRITQLGFEVKDVKDGEPVVTKVQ